MIGPTWLLGAEAILYTDGVLYRIPSGTGDPVELVIGGGGTETDPVFSASPAGSITTTQKTNWNTAYSWGNHASAGYLTAEADTLDSVTTRGNSTSNAITVGGLTVATNLIYTDTVNGRVGIGTTSPTRTLTVNGPIVIPNNSAYYTKATSGSELSVFKADTSNNIQIGSVFFGGGQINYTSTYFDWYNYPSSVVTHRMRLTSSGNLLIGTTTDAGYKLDVNGTTRTTGLIVNTDLIYTDLTSNAVIIGATSLTNAFNKFEVRDTGTTGVVGRLEFRNDNNDYTYLTVTSNNVGFNLGAHSSGTGYISANQSLNITSNQSTNGASVWLGNTARFRVSNAAETLRYLTVSTAGNLLVGTATDAGYMLDVVGTTRLQNQLTTTGSITAVSALARGVYFNNTLVASANNDILVGLDIVTTFTNGAFTNVSNYGLRVANALVSNRLTVTGVGIYATNFRSPAASDTNIVLNGTADMQFYTHNAATNGFRFFNIGTGELMRLYRSGNLVLQTGGTFTDTGYKLQVVGNASFSSATDTYHYITSTATGSAGTIYTNTYHSFFTGTNYATANSWEVYDITSSASRIHISGVTGNVAINQTLAVYKLDVEGDIRSTTGAYLATTSGSVGIGTMTPISKLDVAGDINASGVFAVGGVIGWTGTIFIPTNPPGQQNIQVTGGIITSFS